MQCATRNIFAQPIFFHVLMNFSNFCGKESVVTKPKVGGWENLIRIDVQAPVNGLDVMSGVTTVEISRSIFRFEPF